MGFETATSSGTRIGASNSFNFSVYVEAIDLFGSLDLYVIRYGDTYTAVQS